MSELKSLYLFAGDDLAKLAEARRRFLARARSDGDSDLEILIAAAGSGSDTATSLSAMTLALGRRYLLVDHVEQWRVGDVGPVSAALANLADNTTLCLIVSGKVAPKLKQAVESCQGAVRVFTGPKPWQLPGWAVEQAGKAGLELLPEAAELLVSRVEGSQLRIVSELEKMATALGEGRVGVDQVEQYVCGAADPGVYAFVDAVVAQQSDLATGALTQLRSRGEDALKLVYMLAQRLRALLQIRAEIESGRSVAEAARTLALPPYLAKRLGGQAEKVDPDELRRQISIVAELEFALKGGSALDQDSALVLSVGQLTGRSA